MKIHVDLDRCTGHGVCESIRDDVFEVGEDGIVHILTDALTEEMRPQLDEAVAECPTQALSLEEQVK